MGRRAQLFIPSRILFFFIQPPKFLPFSARTSPASTPAHSYVPPASLPIVLAHTVSLSPPSVSSLSLQPRHIVSHIVTYLNRLCFARLAITIVSQFLPCLECESLAALARNVYHRQRLSHGCPHALSEGRGCCKICLESNINRSEKATAGALPRLSPCRTTQMGHMPHARR